MKAQGKIFYGLSLALFTAHCLGQTAAALKGGQTANRKAIGVIELRNYRVKENQAHSFNDLFVSHFEKPMTDRGVAILGRYQIKNNGDHFVWIRGFEDRNQRVKFLNDFYYHDPEWKKYKKEANALIRNSDNVQLLRPLSATATETARVYATAFKQDKSFVVIDFYTANTRLPELTAFYTKEYLPLLQSAGIEPTLWVGDTVPNDFPQLPVFQDPNVLVSIAYYDNEADYNARIKALEATLTESMKTKLLDMITIHDQLLLNPFKD